MLKRKFFYCLTISNFLYIIVLLILAAVSIATLTGENGILTRANEAKTETEEAKEDELRRLTALEAATNLENTTHTDDSTGEEKTVTIPAGFAVSQVEGENTIEDGLVVIDKNGNEFVWIPVEIEEGETFESKYPRTEFLNNAPTDGLSIDYAEPYVDGYNGEDTEYQAMIDSVTENGGFYVGRYEAGCATLRTETNKTTPQSVVIKRGTYIYNFVPWGKSMNDTGAYEEITGAVELSKNFAVVNNYDINEVTSTLMYGIQWDMILRYVSDKEHDVNDSRSWGNYSDATGNASINSGNINMNFTTGRNEEWKAKNIYDLAGNVYEWTMESCNASKRIVRGGGFDYSGSLRSASSRYKIDPYINYRIIGFRVALYL